MKKMIPFIACAIALIFPCLSASLWSDEEAKTVREEPAPLEIPLQIQVYQREEVIPLLPLLNTWVAQAFGPFPYLYATREDQVVNPSDIIFLNEKNSLIVVAKKGDQVVAVAGASALDSFYLQNYFNPGFIETVKNKGYEPSDYLYVNYFLTAPESRSDTAVIESVYNTIADFGRSTGKSYLTYMDILRSDNHPLKPNIFFSPEPWGTAITGFDAMDLFSEHEWPTYQEDGSIADQTHTLQFYRKSL